MPTPFPAGKTFRELGLDQNRVFVVMDNEDKGENDFKVGDLVKIIRVEIDKEYSVPTCKRLSDGAERYMYLHELAYADSPEQPYIPRVGDRVSLEGEIKEIDSDGYIIFRSSPSGVCIGILKGAKGDLKLLSRKSPRRVSQQEVNAAFGEEVIVEK